MHGQGQLYSFPTTDFHSCRVNSHLILLLVLKCPLCNSTWKKRATLNHSIQHFGQSLHCKQEKLLHFGVKQHNVRAPLLTLPTLSLHYIICIFQHSLLFVDYPEDGSSKLLLNAHTLYHSTQHHIQADEKLQDKLDSFNLQQHFIQAHTVAWSERTASCYTHFQYSLCYQCNASCIITTQY